jgi:glycosyltransferase involved in cell wall biosynthesis
MRDLPGTQLVIAGTGPMKREWENLARELGVEQRMSFVGEVALPDLPAYYEACDIFVLPCSERSEAFGVVQLEAMAAAKPVVSCDVGTGVAWVNQNEVTGLVVPPRDPAALARAIKRILGDKELAAKMGAAGKKRVLEEFTAAKMVEQVMRVYERALN